MSTEISDESRLFYRRTLEVLNKARLPFLVGGTFALEQYTGVVRPTKDLDLFIRQDDCAAILAALERAGYVTEIRFPHWLAKATQGEQFADLIYSSGNGVCTVDDGWFRHAIAGEVMGMPAWLTPPEEMLWSKAYVMERERYDGADVAHLLWACGPVLDWRRLINRFDAHWRVLLSHLVLFGFIYPGERLKIPPWVLRELLSRLEREVETSDSDRRLCQGTLLSWAQYLGNLKEYGYRDARQEPVGTLTPHETQLVTETFQKEQEK